MRRQGGDEGDVARFREIGGRFARSRRLRPNDWTPEEVERRFWDEDVEWAYVFDSAGRQVLRKRGTADGVFFGADEVPVLRDALLIHNHPPQREYPRWDPRYEGGSFSERDLDLMLTYDIAEMRAVTSGWRYVVVRPLGGWVSDAESAVAASSAQMKLLRAEDAFAIEAGDLTEQEADGTRAHRTLLYLAAWGRFSYRREEA